MATRGGAGLHANKITRTFDWLVILNEVYCEYADMMNSDKPLALVRESYKLSVVKAFTDHKDKYGLDKDKIEEYIYMNKHM